MEKHFIPLALDTYFRGNSQEKEFCQLAGAGGNHLVAVTAGGKALGDGKSHRGHVLLTEKTLAPILDEFRKLPENVRKPSLPDPAKATPPRRPVPDPPENGLIIRGYCTYMESTSEGPKKAKRFYYEENPNAWAAETQSDMLWLTEAEWRSLIPEDLKPGQNLEVPEEIQRRLFGTIGIDYMEGSVNALPVSSSNMKITVEGSKADTVTLSISGTAAMGKSPTPGTSKEGRTRGSQLNVIGRIVYDKKKDQITAFDLAGIGNAWGNKMEYTNRAIRLKSPTWRYGIAAELVTTRTPYDLVPPYNLLHYGGGMKYFASK